MKFLKINSYAKINLSLNIVGKLRNKLHKIESLVSFLDLKDEIYLKKINSKKHKIYFRGKFSSGIPKKNTVFELLRLIDKKQLLNDQKFEVKIIKNIPQKSGMGGGSMNAACLMSFFIKKNFFKLKKNELVELNNLIGSDVILGMNQKNTVLSSNGRTTRYNYNLNYYIIVAKPDFGCSTKFIYSKIKYFSKSKYNFPKKSLFFKRNILNSQNALEKIAFKKYTKLKQLKLYMSNLPNIIFTRMTGSGSSIVAYFHSKRARDVAAKEFKAKFNNYWCITSKTI